MNPRVEKILNLPAYQRFLIMIVIMALICAGFYFGSYQGQMEEHEQLLSRLESAKERLVKNQRIANNLAVYKAEYEKMQARLAEALNELPLEREIPNLLTGVANLARNRGLEIVRFKPASEVTKEFYAEVPVELKLAGSYHQAGAFFDSISKMERIVNIQGLSLGSPKDIDGKTSLSIDCRAVTFRFVNTPPDQGTSKQKKGGKRK